MTKVTNDNARDLVNSIENACFQIRKQAKLATSGSRLYQRISQRSKLFRKPHGALLHMQPNKTLDLSKNEQFSRPQNSARRAPIQQEPFRNL